MSNSYSFYRVKVILVVTVLNNRCWINPPIKSPEGRMDFIWINILKVIKTKSAAPERVFSLQNFIINHHFLLTLFELSNLCFCKHKFFQIFVCWVMLTNLFHHFSFSLQGFEIKKKKSKTKNICYFSGKSHCNFTYDFHIISFISKDIFNSLQYLSWPHQCLS